MCTNLNIKAANGEVVVARSMDFASPTGVSTSEWPVGHKINRNWTVKIPFIGKYTEKDALGINVRCVSDGFNKAGLSLGTLWLPSAEFKNTPIVGIGEISALIVPQVILGTCNTVDEAVKFLNSHTLVLPSKYIDRFATLHFALVDKSGASAVVEFGTDGKPSSVHVYPNPVGVLTNAPEFPWQLRNLSNFTQIGLNNTESKKFGGYEVKHTGFGANQLGLAGDASPPSRFVRAVTLMHAAIAKNPPQKAADAELILDKVMGSVAVIQGTSCDAGLTKAGDKWDYTQWIVLKNLNNYTMKIKTAGDLGFKDIVPAPVSGDDDPEDSAFAALAGMSDEQSEAFADEPSK